MKSPLGKVPPDWELSSLGDITGKIGSGATPRGGEQVYLAKRHRYALIRSQAVHDHSLDLAALSYITDEDARRLANAEVRTGDVLLNITGDGTTFGRASLAPDEVLPACVNQHVSIIRPNPDKLVSGFLLSYLTHPVIKAYIESFNAGGSRRAITKGHIESFVIPLPPLPEQKEIASLLGLLNTKIELNLRINETLEATARALFKDWFVDFGPTRAKAERQAGYLAPPIWDLFPNRLDDEDKPEGWPFRPLTELFDFMEGPGIRNWQYTNSDEGTKFINIRCIQDHDLELTTANRVTDMEANGKYSHFHLREDDIVVSTSGTLGRWALVRQRHLPLLLNTSVIRFRPKNGVSSLEYLRCYVDQPSFVNELELRAVGSVQKNFGPMHLKQMTVMAPPAPIGKAFSTICAPLFEQWKVRLSENDQLAECRDLLLPKLLTGEIRLRDAERIVRKVS